MALILILRGNFFNILFFCLVGCFRLASRQSLLYSRTSFHPNRRNSARTKNEVSIYIIYIPLNGGALFKF